ncbi:MAG: response regulator [Rhodospirillaceae bacterium]|nr:response regulator [Rhodospirillaceae bacterium]
MTNMFEQHTVLLVDDEASSRALVGQMLRRLGFREVLLAEDGYQAVEILNSQQVTAVVTDFRMPGIHGLQLLKYIRTGQTYAPRNLICGMLTSYAERELVGLAIVLDVDTFLAKPVSMETITKHLKRSFAYRFEPLDVDTYMAVDVENAAPHLTTPSPFDLPRPPPRTVAPPPPPPPPQAPPEEKSAEAPPAPAAPPAKPPPDKAAPGKAAPSQPAPGKAAPGKLAPAKSMPGKPVPAKAAKPAPERSDDKPAKKVKLEDVPENALLARDLYGAGGTLLLAAGTRFKTRYIKRLEELRELKEKIDHVWITEE